MELHDFTVIAIALVAIFIGMIRILNKQKELRKFMSEQSDKITAAFDAYKVDVSAKLDALAKAVKPGMTDAEVDAVLADITQAKTDLDTPPPVVAPA